MIATPERTAPSEIEWWTIEPELPELGRTPIARRLMAAAMLLERDGWCQNEYISQDGQRCLMGAVQMVSWDGFLDWDERQDSLVLKTSQFLLTVLGRPNGELVVWNDARGRQLEEVAGLLLEAAAKAEAAGA